MGYEEYYNFALYDGSRKVFICGGSAGCEDEVITPRLSAFLDYITGKLFQMLTNGMSQEDISRYTSIPLQEVLAAREKHYIGI